MALPKQVPEQMAVESLSGSWSAQVSRKACGRGFLFSESSKWGLALGSADRLSSTRNLLFRRFCAPRCGPMLQDSPKWSHCAAWCSFTHADLKGGRLDAVWSPCGSRACPMCSRCAPLVKPVRAMCAQGSPRGLQSDIVEQNSISTGPSFSSLLEKLSAVLWWFLINK